MLRHSRRSLIASGLSLMATPALAQGAWYPLFGADGREVPNFRVPVEIETEITELDNALLIGSAEADITITEIYDSNCGYCRRAARDIHAMVEADPDLAVRFINAPSLGIPSFQAARVEYAVKQLGGDDKAKAYQAASMAARGVFDGVRGLEIAADLGLDRAAIEDLADKQETGQVLAQAARLANSANLAATPSFLLAGVALIGWPGRTVLEAAVKAVRQCDKPVCD